MGPGAAFTMTVAIIVRSTCAGRFQEGRRSMRTEDQREDRGTAGKADEREATAAGPWGKAREPSRMASGGSLEQAPDRVVVAAELDACLAAVP